MKLVLNLFCFVGFDKVPTPTQLTVTLGERYTYMCNHSETNRITWKINDQVLGVQINDIPGINYTDFISSRGGAEVYTLTIRALPQNNETTIQCTAAFSGGSPPEETPTATFLIQGHDQLKCVCVSKDYDILLVRGSAFRDHKTVGQVLNAEVWVLASY